MPEFQIQPSTTPRKPFHSRAGSIARRGNAFRVVLALCLVSAAPAQVIWDGGAEDGNWNAASNWNPDGVPTETDDVIIDLDEPPTSLGDGYRVEVRVVIYEREDVLRVPTSSLFRHEGDWAVFTVERGKAQLRRIEIGRRTGLLAEVLAGLEPDEQVIVHPSDAISDGVRAAPRQSG